MATASLSSARYRTFRRWWIRAPAFAQGFGAARRSHGVLEYWGRCLPDLLSRRRSFGVRRVSAAFNRVGRERRRGASLGRGDAAYDHRRDACATAESKEPAAPSERNPKPITDHRLLFLQRIPDVLELGAKEGDLLGPEVLAAPVGEVVAEAGVVELFGEPGPEVETAHGA